jgi:site-specific recombinase XerD
MFLAKQSNGYYYIYDYVNGKRIKKTTKVKNFNDANKIFMEYKNKLKNITTIELVNIFLNYKKSYMSDNTFINYKSILQQFIKSLDNTKIYINQITQEDINNYFIYISKLKLNSVLRVLSVIKVFFYFAIKNKYVSENFDYPKISKPETFKEFLTIEEFEKLLGNCDSIDLQDIIAVVFCTGLRISEAVNLRWNNVNFEKKYLIVDNKYYKTKTKIARKLDLNDFAFNILAKRNNLKHNEFVFNYKKSKWLVNTLQDRFINVVKKCDFDKKITFHNLRHSFASNLVIMGVPILNVSKLLGHKNINTTLVYSHLNDDSLKSSVKKLDMININKKTEVDLTKKEIQETNKKSEIDLTKIDISKN